MSKPDKPHHLNGQSDAGQEAYTEDKAAKFQEALSAQRGVPAQGYREIRSNAGNNLPILAGAEAEVLITYNNAARHASEAREVPSDKVSKADMKAAETRFKEALRAAGGRVGETVANSYFGVVQEAAIKALGITLVKTKGGPRG